jgi:hypothetical protein
MSDWGIRTREHTFASGRTATLREQLPMTELIRQGVFTDELLVALDKVTRGELEEASQAFKLTDAICFGMFVEPRIDLAGQGEQEGDVWKTIPIGFLDEGEIAETIDLAFESLNGAARFRGDERSTRDRTDGGGVRKPAKRASRVAPAKRGGAASRPKAR